MNSRRTALGLLLGMAASAALAEWARPTILESDARHGLELSTLIPQAFGPWTIDRNMPVVLPPPDQQALLNKIYNQTLARTYVNAEGYRIMLSLAYGGDQSDGLTVHLPEICYVGQGFRLLSNHVGRMTLGGLTLPVRRLVTELGPRHEPITYWVTHGDEATVSAWQRRMISIRYGLRREIPDGMLVRVSSIDRSDAQAFEMQRKFLVDLASALSQPGRNLLLGTVSVAASS